jgi:pimeloyl-ACP methyl ester carboxylesterase
MKQNEVKIPKGLLHPLTINGLNGRFLRIPHNNKKRNILVIYGHHSSLERMYGIVENIADYGTVTMPDLPGFGGMDSFYSLGKKPSLDDYADYLATFIKLKFRTGNITIMGMSFGFVVVLRMLQKYPDIAKRVNFLVSIVGFSDKSDFKLSARNQFLLRTMSRTFSFSVMSFLMRYIGLNKFSIGLAYRINAKNHPKMQDADKNELKRRIRFEVYLWQINDVRSYMATMLMMFTLKQNPTKLPFILRTVSVSSDQYFNEEQVLNNFRNIFPKVVNSKINLKNHAPSVIGNKEESKVFIPKSLRKALDKI